MDPNIPDFIRSALADWFGKAQRSLPWRESADPYHIWVSEVMLQQTQVKTVLPYYQRFIQTFPEISDLAVASQGEVLKLWEGLGYYARARNLHKAAGMVVAEDGGAVPDNWKRFRRLPGVGEYIAAAVQSIAFGHAHAVIDGNVKRVLARVFAMDAPVNRASAHWLFKRRADELLDPRDPGTFNQALMELGALICRPHNPICDRCPLASRCQAYQKGETARYPVRERRKPVPEHAIAIGVIVKDKKVLITQRRPDGLLGGLWEFPGGKILEGETPEEACVREIQEETGLEVTVDRYLSRIRHAYTHFKIQADVFVCQYINGRVRLNGPVDHRWIPPARIPEYPFPGANKKFIPLIMEGILPD